MLVFKHQTAVFWRMVGVLLVPQVRSTPVVMSVEIRGRPADFSAVGGYGL